MRISNVVLIVGLLSGCVITGDGVAKKQDRTLPAFDTIETTDIVDVVVREGAPVDGVAVVCDGNVIDMLETRVSGGILTVGFSGGSVSTSTTCEVATGNMQIVELISLGISDITVSGPAWSLDTIRSESVGNITVDLRPGQVLEAPAEASETLLELPEEGAEESETLQDLPDEGADESSEEGGSESEDDWPYDDSAPEAPSSLQADRLLIESLDLGEVRVTGLDRVSVEVRAEGVGEIALEGSVNDVAIEVIDLTDVDARDLTSLEAWVYADGVGDIQVTALERADVENIGIGTVTVYGNPAERSVVNDSVGEVHFR